MIEEEEEEEFIRNLKGERGGEERRSDQEGEGGGRV